MTHIRPWGAVARTSLLGRLFICGLVALTMAGLAQAQVFPSRPIRFVVPIPAGGSTDVLAREIARRLQETWGQPVVVDNRPGAAGSLGADIVAKSPADGYTILLVNVGHVINASVYPKLPFDSIKDFAPVVLMAAVPLGVVVHPSVPVKSLPELIAYAKAHPGQLNFGSSGNGGASHLAGELFKSLTGVQLTHVPYKGSAPAVADLLAGQTQVMFPDMAVVVPHIKAGRVRPLAVATQKRLAVLPDVPTGQEVGVPGFEVAAWVGILAPASTPKEIVTKFNSEIVRILQQPDMREKLAAQGFDVIASSPEQFGVVMRADVEKFSRVVKAAGVKVD